MPDDVELYAPGRSSLATPEAAARRYWGTDPDVAPDETLDPVDYKGASAALKIDRGHQANLASMGGVADWPTLNYFTNITPRIETRSGLTLWSYLPKDVQTHLKTRRGQLSRKIGCGCAAVGDSLSPP